MHVPRNTRCPPASACRIALLRPPDWAVSPTATMMQGPAKTSAAAGRPAWSRVCCAACSVRAGFIWSSARPEPGNRPTRAPWWRPRPPLASRSTSGCRPSSFPDRPEDAAPAWYLERIARATEMIWTISQQLVAGGVDVVLEIGLTARADRDAFYERVRRAGHRLTLHVVDAPRELRWSRVEARNREQGAYLLDGRHPPDVRLRPGSVGALRRRDRPLPGRPRRHRQGRALTACESAGCLRVPADRAPRTMPELTIL